MDLPNNLTRVLDEHWDHIQNYNVDTFDPKLANSGIRTVSLVFKISDGASKKIAEALEKIPDDLKKEMVFQPYQGYHLTIQWFPEEHLSLVNERFFKDLLEVFAGFKIINGSLVFPLLGRAGLLGTIKTETDLEMSHIRSEVNGVWKKYNLPFGLDPKYEGLSYMSLSRFVAELTQEEKFFLKEYPQQEIPGIALSQARLVLNDKFMTPENTKVLQTFDLMT